MFYQSHCIGSVLHVCNGTSPFGDLRIDRYSNSTDIRADYRHLPIKDNSFDTVICDPYWGKSERVDKGLIDWLSELRRVAKQRIIIIHNSLFVLPKWKLVDAYAVKARGYWFWKVVQIHEPDNPVIPW